MRRLPSLLLLCAFLLPLSPTDAAPTVDLSQFKPASGAAISRDGTLLKLTWPASSQSTASLTLDLNPRAPLIHTLAISPPAGGALQTIIRNINPVLLLTIGQRNLRAENDGGWTVFFDNPITRPHHTVSATLAKKTATARTDGARIIIRIGDVTAASFRGALEISVWNGSPLVFIETILSTQEDGRAILYDAGLAAPVSPGKPWSDPATTTHSSLVVGAAWKSLAWLDATDGELRRAPPRKDYVAAPMQVRRRILAAENDGGSIAAFPPPHQYFPPLDFANNLGFVWHGASRSEVWRGYGFGIHQPLDGDRVWVPWINAPPNTEQRLGVFYALSAGTAREAIATASRYTRDDRYKRLPGHITFASHFHIEHALEFAKAQLDQKTTGIPAGLETPGFVKTFKAHGVDLVHLTEFHVGAMPGLPANERLPLLKIMHDECARLSRDGLLVLPGEEPNVHLGGHWVSFFPKPVNWILNRAPGEPFEENVPGHGTVYRVGSPDDVLRLMEKENGLMWTPHPRIKGSRGYPDAYWNEPFFRSDRFLGAAWKAMPADLSQPRLGRRVLDVLDDMANAGLKKHVLAEADLFRMDADYESYAHMNINYLQLDRAPRYEDGWQPVLDTLRTGKFFSTTGEVLIPKFSVNKKGSTATVEAELEWTFPLAFAEIISGDGKQVFRHRIELSDTQEHGHRKLSVPLSLEGRRWVRLEVWDAARNGAFTQPIWLE